MTVAVAACLVVLLVTASSVNLLPRPVSFHLGQLFPEGWKLFVADADVPRHRAFVRDGSVWRQSDHLPLAQPRNVMGLNRGPRWQSVELTRLAALRPDLEDWTRCRRRVARCLDAAARDALPASSPTAYSTLCGRVGLVREGFRTPEEARAAGSHRYPTHAIVLQVRC